MEERESQRRERQLKWTLDNAQALGRIGADQARRIQELINEGSLDLAAEETTQLGLPLASEEEMQTERVEATTGDLEKQLANNVAMGNIDLSKATQIQTLINSGDLELAREELASAERMQAGRIESEEGMFADEMEFQEAMATGQINGMPTLEGMLTRAELADRLTARQAESLGQLLALANAMPEGQREKVMASIARPVQQLMEGRGYTEVKIAISSILNVDPEDYGG